MTNSSRKSTQEIEEAILDKIKFQWKTIRKAFYDLNKGRSGAIMEEELKFYLDHWGFQMSEEQFNQVFKKFDFDCDGKISFDDFQKTIGNEIHPGETLYFRQEFSRLNKNNKCKHQ